MPDNTINLEEKLNESLKAFKQKEFEMYHYEYYIQNLIKFENYIKKNDLIEKAFEGTRSTLDKYNYNKQKLEDSKTSLKTVTKELIYKTHYQNFEEYIYKIIFSIYTFYPEFIKKDSEQIIMNYDSVFSTKNIDDLKNSIIEKRVKDLIQSNNIVNLLKKMKSLFGVDLELEISELNFLFVTAQNRNILSHNGGIINSIYINELNKNKIKSRYKLGENIIENINIELNEIEDNISNIGEKIFNKLSQKINQINSYAKNI